MEATARHGAAAPARIAGLDSRRFSLLAVNVLGGLAVLGSYAWGLADPAVRGGLWGGVPESLRPVYTVNMFLAAGGYFLFSPYVFFRLDPERTRLAGGWGYGAFVALYGLLLVTAALWLPLTAAYLSAPGVGLWAAIRGVLLLTGLASLGLGAAIATARPVGSVLGRRLALVGIVPFAFQTAVLDALVWPAYFPF